MGRSKKLRLSSTSSRLFLDCPTSDTEGEYTCVAETPYQRDSMSTVVRVGEYISLSGILFHHMFYFIHC